MRIILIKLIDWSCYLVGKHTVLTEVVIDKNGKVTAYGVNKTLIKLSRSQFSTFLHYKLPDYTDKVRDSFQNQSVLSDSFKLIDERNNFNKTFVFNL